MRTVTEWRTFVRTYMETDTEDQPDLLIDSWLQEGVATIRQRQLPQPHFQAKATISVVAGTQTYSMPVDAVTSAAFRDIYAANGYWGALDKYPHRDATDEFTLTDGTVTTGTPEGFSLWQNTIYLWPSPTVSHTLTLFGYRKLKVWYSTSAPGDSVPDLPDEYEPALASWVLGEGFKHAADTEGYTFYKADFEEKLRTVLEDQLRVSTFGPRVVGGRRSGSRWRGPSFLRRG